MFNHLVTKFAATRPKISADSVDVPTIIVNESTVANLMNAVYFWTGLIAVLVIIIAGFYYVTSNGDSAQIERAKKAMTGAVIGLIIIMFAFVITQVVISGVTKGA